MLAWSALCAACAGGAAPSGRELAVPTAAPEVPTAAPDAGALAAEAGAPGARWLRGSTHVHARPSGDSSTEIAEVVAWYEQRGYDFIALTDHNRVSELALGVSTAGQVSVRAPERGLIVLAGIELTHNPAICVPLPPEPLGKCRIHVNALGVTARPDGKLEWAERQSEQRVDQYARALDTARALGGVAQLNHVQWHWGMSAELLTELARRGASLVEIANVQFERWNAGDGPHPSTEALWDAALAAGAVLWGVASDDAHSYDGSGPYPAGGGWVMVRAERSPAAIVAALAAGQFYSSTGVELTRAERVGDELVVEVAPGSAGEHRIVFVENGVHLPAIAARAAVRALPARGYVRAVVSRSDGARAWVQPAHR